jgi:hypothetical protein
MQKGQFGARAELYYCVCGDFFPRQQIGIGFADYLHDHANGIGFGRVGKSWNRERGDERKNDAV